MVTLYIRSGLQFTPLTDRLRATVDDITEICGVRLLGQQTLDVINIYRPPISWSDNRVDNFDPGCLPNNSNTLLLGDIQWLRKGVCRVCCSVAHPGNLVGVQNTFFAHPASTGIYLANIMLTG